jgi:hypothetical protein
MDGGEYEFVAVPFFKPRNPLFRLPIADCQVWTGRYSQGKGAGCEALLIGNWQSAIGNHFHGPKRPRYSTEFMKPLIMLR